MKTALLLLLGWCLDRLSENSTWRGLILVATALGVYIEPKLGEAIIALGLAAVGVINIIRKGSKNLQPTVPQNIIPKAVVVKDQSILPE